jgi:hypothetical protein
MMGRPKVETSWCSPQLDPAMRAPSEALGTGARAWWKSIARIDRICQCCFFVCVLFLQRSDLETAGSQKSIPIGSVAIRLLFFLIPPIGSGKVGLAFDLDLDPDPNPWLEALGDRSQAVHPRRQSGVKRAGMKRRTVSHRIRPGVCLKRSCFSSFFLESDLTITKPATAITKR